jgi:adenosylcobinamide-GDP ribazoletransferase
VTLPAPLRGVRAAVVFLTRVPVGGSPYSAADWRWAAAHFPLVGAAVGAATGTATWLLAPLGPWAAAILAMGVSLLLTGALHEDGLADTSDALGGGHSREKVLAILKDSRIGVFGGCALVVSIAGRGALVAKLGASAPWALVLVGAAARTGPIWLIATMRYVTDTAVARSKGVMAAGALQALAGSAWTLVATIGVCRHVPLGRAAGVAVACALVTMLTAWRYQRRVGGITGDFLGATEQLCELAGLAVLAWPSS